MLLIQVNPTLVKQTFPVDTSSASVTAESVRDTMRPEGV